MTISVTTANIHISNLRDKLNALKASNGQCLAEFIVSFDESSRFKDVVVLKGANDETKLIQIKALFYQALLDNVEQRFPCDELLINSLALNKMNWPSDPIELALYGDRQVAALCKGLGIDAALICDILVEFTVFKKTNVSGARLDNLRNQIETYPVSTAACERGFSQMALCHTKQRNCLSAERVSSLLMITINGPPIAQWNAKKYVISWIRKGHKWATDNVKVAKKMSPPISSASQLFL